MKKISTSALAKNLKVDWKELFSLLESNNLITRNWKYRYRKSRWFFT